jgi:plasmid stability protein
MATITIRNLDEKIKRRLQVRAALNGRSMEAEAREVLSGQLADNPRTPGEDMGTGIHKRLAALRGVDLDIPRRQFSTRTPPDFGQNASERGIHTYGPVMPEAEPEEDFGTAIRKLFAPVGGIELQIPKRRKSHRPIPTFD